MKLFDLESPLMSFLNKVADLLWLNILTMICCIPIITAGASLTALHHMALKIVRNEEGYITRGFFKSFKENFKQATAIWMILLFVILILAGDYYIILTTEMEFPAIVKIIITAATVLIMFTALYVFPVLARFENTVKRTIKNAFMMSVLQLPKTVLMVIVYLIPPVLAMVSYKMFPIVFLFGISVPAFVSALLYNKFFKKLEEQIIEANGGNVSVSDEEGDERIFKDELEDIPGAGNDTV